MELSRELGKGQRDCTELRIAPHVIGTVERAGG